jgi:hypothetical protein
MSLSSSLGRGGSCLTLKISDVENGRGSNERSFNVQLDLGIVAIVLYILHRTLQ